MAYQYLNPETIADTYSTSKSYTDGLTDKFQEYERIAGNKPHGSIPKEYPKTTDGTTASIIRKTPHRIIQQIPTGKIKSIKSDWLPVVAEFIYLNKIIPNANEDYALIQKCWQVVERSLAFGFCGTYTPFTEHNGYFCTDLRLIYWADIALQPGKLSDADSNYIFMRSWWQTKDIDALIESQKKLDKKSRTWDVEALERVKKIETTKDDKSKTPSERAQKVDAQGGVELITGFQRGVKSKFYTFHVQNTGTGSAPVYAGTIVRTKINKDPRGEMPISFAYGDIDGSNPFGRSVIDLVGPIQNLIDSEMQMYQYNRALGLNPPLIKRGNFSKNKIKFAPNVIIDVGSDENANVEPLKIDTTALANFPNNYGLMKSQMLNLLASPDTSISSEVGNPGFSKTPQGVEASRANLSVDDHYMRKQFETWFERWSETAINLYFAEREGIEELQLDQKAADELRKLAEEGKFDMNQLSEDNKIRINYSSATEALKFEVDASTSKTQDEAQQLQALNSLEDLLRKSDLLQGIVPMEKQIGLWNAFVKNSGVDEPEKLSMTTKEIQNAQEAEGQKAPDPRENVIVNYKDMPEDMKRVTEKAVFGTTSEGQSPQQQQLDNQGEKGLTPEHILKADQQAHQQEVDKERIMLDTQKQQHDMMMAEQTAMQGPESTESTPATPQRQLTPEDRQLIEALQQIGASEQEIGQALAILHSGVSAQEIMQMFQGVTQ